MKMEYLAIIENNDTIAELRKFKTRCDVYEVIHDNIIETLWAVDNKVMLGIYPHDHCVRITNDNNEFLFNNVEVIKDWLAYNVLIADFLSVDAIKSMAAEDKNITLIKLT